MIADSGGTASYCWEYKVSYGSWVNLFIVNSFKIGEMTTSVSVEP